MKIEYEGRVFLIEFSYRTVATDLKSNTDATACKILDGSAIRQEREPAPTICYGEVRRYFEDKPDRAKARKEALNSALDNLDLAIPAGDGGPRRESERWRRRKLFWGAYLNRKKPSVDAAIAVCWRVLEALPKLEAELAIAELSARHDRASALFPKTDSFGA